MLRKGRDRIAQAATAGGDPYQFETSEPPSRVGRDIRRIILFSAIGIVTYLVALLATIPARIALPPSGGLTGVSGTVWHGEGLLAGGNRLEWRWAPLRSIAHFALAADWTVTGVRTDLGGQALMRADGAVLEAVTGRGDASLLRALAPGTAINCDMPMQFDIERLALGGDDHQLLGEIRSDAGTCITGGTPATPVPALIMSAVRDGRKGTNASLAPLGQRRRELIGATMLPSGALHVEVTPDGAAVLPFLAAAGVRSMDVQL